MALLPTQFSDLLEAGTDEAGRGCLAGPVTAAAVILPKDYSDVESYEFHLLYSFNNVCLYLNF